ncbi:MAG: diguanylate cyclase [Acidobacteria bacterium]|nr:diguanylate cyclase [Acidobacteriota bacterium]
MALGPIEYRWGAALLLLAVGGGIGAWIGHRVGRVRWAAKLARVRRAMKALQSANDHMGAVLESLERAAGTDRLTGAWNRRRCEEAVAAEVALARRRKGAVSILMMDIDHFKRINDTHGHEAGDAVLAGLAAAWRKVLRASDPLVRWGGEEFLVLSPASQLEGAMTLAEKLLVATREVTFPGLGPVTVSVGVAEHLPGESWDAWIHRADGALYRAKAEGRDRAVAAEGSPVIPSHLPSILELTWEAAYASGHPLIDEQHRRLFELANGVLAAFVVGLPREETLLRWNRLAAHAAQHFSDEERLFAEAGFPGLEHHAVEHQNLLAKVRELQTEVEQGTLELGRLVDFLAVHLVKGHLLQEDWGTFK